jgi:hypothetical protein
VAIIRAISNVAIPAAIAKLANVCRSDYGVRCSNPAALSAGFRASQRQLCRSVCPPFSAGAGAACRGVGEGKRVIYLGNREWQPLADTPNH